MLYCGLCSRQLFTGLYAAFPSVSVFVHQTARWQIGQSSKKGQKQNIEHSESESED